MRISEERPQQCESDVKIVFVRGTMAYELVEPLLGACVFVSGDEKLLRGRKDTPSRTGLILPDSPAVVNRVLLHLFP